MDLKEIPAGSFDRHPWEVARAQFFEGELCRASLLAGRRRVLDVGAGDAWLAHRFADAGPGLEFVCWDVGYDSVPPPRHDRIRYSAARPEGTFDLVLMLDVAEHVEHDRDFVGDLVRCLMNPAAHLLFSVPAWPRLYGTHDAALGHHRRYTPEAARQLLHASGLRIVRGGGLFHSLVLPRYMEVARERQRGGGVFPRPGITATPPKPEGLSWKRGRVLRGCVQMVLDADNALSRAAASAGADLPGLSWWALCQRA